jgi:hypothetical protein
MTPQEERLVLELHAKWGNRSEESSRNRETLKMFFFFLTLKMFFVCCLSFWILSYAGGQKLPGNYRGEQIMR